MANKNKAAEDKNTEAKGNQSPVDDEVKTQSADNTGLNDEGIENANDNTPVDEGNEPYDNSSEDDEENSADEDKNDSSDDVGTASKDAPQGDESDHTEDNRGQIDDEEEPKVFYVKGYGNVNGCKTLEEAEEKAHKILKARRG